jgi:hypothetical protein
MDSLRPDGGTELPVVWKDGGDEAPDPRMPKFYSKLNRLAHEQLCRKTPDHTLQHAAMTHEIFLRLFRPGWKAAKLWFRRTLERTAQP